MGSGLQRADRRRKPLPAFSRAFSRPSFNLDQSIDYLDIDRARAQALGVNMTNVFNALQRRSRRLRHQLHSTAAPGRSLFGRRRQSVDISSRADLCSQQHRRMLPIRSIAGLKIVTGPQVITHNKSLCSR